MRRLLLLFVVSVSLASLLAVPAIAIDESLEPPDVPADNCSIFGGDPTWPVFFGICIATGARRDAEEERDRWYGEVESLLQLTEDECANQLWAEAVPWDFDVWSFQGNIRTACNYLATITQHVWVTYWYGEASAPFDSAGTDGCMECYAMGTRTVTAIFVVVNNEDKIACALVTGSSYVNADEWSGSKVECN